MQTFHTISKFAEDGVLLFKDSCRKSFISLKIEIMTVRKWSDVNKLSLDLDKDWTKFMAFDNSECDKLMIQRKTKIIFHFFINK